jgi:hypothetical protein
MRYVVAESDLPHVPEDLVLTAAAAIVRCGPPREVTAGRLSIAITAKVLSMIDLLIAQCTDIDLDEIHEDIDQRRYPMATKPVRLDTLSGDVAVLVRAADIAEPVGLVLAVRLEGSCGCHGNTFAVHHEFGDVTLTAAAPSARMLLPFSDFIWSSDPPA